MKAINKNLTIREIEFLIKQEVVYLEKEIINAKNNNKDFYLAFISKNNWKHQTSSDTFSFEVLSEMIDTRNDILRKKDDFEGSFSVRFFDTNMLSILFVGCDKKRVNDFCDKLKKTCVCSPPTNFKFEYIGDEIYKFAYQMNENKVEKIRKIDVGLSYQQNYLAHVVSQDRNEPMELLLSEAVNQAIFKYHQVMNNE